MRTWRRAAERREEVVSLMLTAGTLEQIEAAWRAARRHIEEHPEDEAYICEAGESLEMKRLALEELAREGA